MFSSGAPAVIQRRDLTGIGCFMLQEGLALKPNALSIQDRCICVRTSFLPTYEITSCYLCGSESGPTGDLESSNGELPICTSCSRLRQSFLSSPASLPAKKRFQRP